MMSDYHPLVSVFVVSYNAAEYICETLDSIKAQTYDKIELIVSDDNSSDNTVHLANEWIENNKERFVRTEVLTVDHNTGVSANYNRALKACNGEWVKNVDGDDLLFANCVEDNIAFVINNKDACLIFSDVCVFKGKDKNNKIGNYFTEEKKIFFKYDYYEQFKYLLHKNILPSQSCFVKLETIKKFPYNESYKGLEDEPMWINLTKNGCKVYFFDKQTAYYRIDESMTSSNARFFSPIYAESEFLYFWNEKINYIRENNLQEAYNANRKHLLVIEFADVVLKNKKTIINDIIFKIARKVIYKYSTFRM